MPRLAVVMIAVSLVLTACLARSDTHAQEANHNLTQWAGAHGGSNDPATRVIRNESEWRALWEQLEREPPKALDARREMAVAIFLGLRSTGGYRAEVITVRHESGQLVVDYREHTPAADQMVTQALTTPWVVVVVPVSDLPVVARKVGRNGAN